MISNGTLNFVRTQIADQFYVNNFEDDLIEVSLPYFSGDGDGYTLFVQQLPRDRWLVTDRGETLAHASVRGVNLCDPKYLKQLGQITHFFGLKIEDGELTMEKDSDSLGEAIHAMTQACFEVGRLARPATARKRREAKRELIRKRSTPVIKRVAVGRQLEFGWTDPEHDPEGAYPVDFMIDGERPLLMAAVASPQDVWRTAAIFGHFKMHGTKQQGVAIVRGTRKPVEEKRLADAGAVILDCSVPREFETRLRELCSG